MKTNKPIIVDGVTYDQLGASLSSMPIFTETLPQTVSMRFQYYSKDESGNIIRPENPFQYDVPVVFADIMNSGDQDAIIAFQKITEAIQDYINAKGL